MLASLFSVRMLGLFMILPVFSLYAEGLQAVTPFLIGVAMGAYGFTQALLQIPFGMLSDHFGRKPVIVVGLLLFAIGSVIAANADSIFTVIIGRAIQGSGAIAAVVMALAADLTRPTQRTKAMATIGMSIGASFLLALVLGPILEPLIGVPGIFWMTAVLALLGLLLVVFFIPQPLQTSFHHDVQTVPAQFHTIFRNHRLMQLNISIFVLHTILTASFVVLPLVFRDNIGIMTHNLWQIYLPVLLLSVVFMIPFIILAERRWMQPIFKGAIISLGLAEFGLIWFSQSLAGIIVCLLLFFTAFNLMEACLPSLLSKLAPSQNKGTAMGIYSSFQFIGAFLGGTIGGTIYGAFSLQAVFIFTFGMVTLWLLGITAMGSTAHLQNLKHDSPKSTR